MHRGVVDDNRFCFTAFRGIVDISVTLTSAPDVYDAIRQAKGA